MRHEITGDLERLTFDSLNELAEHAATMPAVLAGHFDDRSNFLGVEYATDAVALALDGWHEHAAQALALAEDAVTKVQVERPVSSYVRTIGVRGKRADIGRLVVGMPDSLVSLRPVEIVKAGKVITLCASVEYSGAVSVDSIVRRGQAMVGLAIALQRCGYACEIWTDTTAGRLGFERDRISVRTLIKGAHDVIDPSRLMFALAHPAMLRVFAFACREGTEWYRRNGKQFPGMPADPVGDLPEGTIYLPAVSTKRDIPDLDKTLTGYLRDLGILTEGS